MMRALVALMVLVLMGNPACCCVLGTVGAGADNRAAEGAPTCCREAAGEEEKGGTPGVPSPCPCSKRLGPPSPSKAVVPVPTPVPGSGTLPPAPPRSRSLRPLFSRDRVSSLYRGLPPEAPPLRLLHGVFRC